MESTTLIETAVQKCPSTLKRSFESAQDADAFHENNRAEFGGVRQYSYPCEDCNSYHLTAIPPGTYNSTTNYEQIANSRIVKPRGETTEQVRKLLNEAKSTSEIAKLLSITEAAVQYHKRKIEGTLVPRNVEVITIESISEREKQLTAQLASLQQQKAELIEAKKVKVAKQLDGMIVISQQAQRIQLSPDDALEAHINLGEVLGL